MISNVLLKIFNLSAIILANFQSRVDCTPENVCHAPLWAPGNPAAERIHVENVSRYSPMFLSDVTTLPAFCSKNHLVYRLEIEEPSEEDPVMNTARRAIRETSPDNIEAAKRHLIQLLKSDPKLNAPLDNDAWLIRFLRLRKYNVQAAYDSIKNYYYVRAHNRSLYRGLVPSKESRVAENNAISTLPIRDQDGRRILIIRTRNWKPKQHTLLEEWKVGVVLTEAMAYEPATQLAGVQVVIDAQGTSLQQIRQFTNPFLAKRIMDWVLRAVPLRYGGIHIVRQPRIFWAASSFFKPLFYAASLKNKIFFHGNDMKSLHRQIDPSRLPAEYGGSLPTTCLSGYEWKVALESFDKEYAKISSYGMKGRK